MIVTYQAVLSSPVGKLGIRTSESKLLGIDYLSDEVELVKPKNIIAKETVEQLLCYFADPTYQFNLPLELDVSHFQKTVLEFLQRIPTGTTQSYAKLAQNLNTSPRPIGNACRKNPLPIVIPCHRVIAEKNLGGYNGDKRGRMIDIKRWLLEHEDALIS